MILGTELETEHTGEFEVTTRRQAGADADTKYRRGKGQRANTWETRLTQQRDGVHQNRT